MEEHIKCLFLGGQEDDSVFGRSRIPTEKAAFLFIPPKLILAAARSAAANQKKTRTSHIGTPEPSVASAKECQAALFTVGVGVRGCGGAGGVWGWGWLVIGGLLRGWEQ